MAFLDDLRAVMKKDGRPHSELARASGIHVKSLSRFINGHRGLSVETAELLARSLGYSLRLTRAVKKKN